MKVYLTANPTTDWAPLPTGEYPSARASLAAIVENENCSRDDFGNDPGLIITPAVKPHINGYDTIYGRSVDVSEWPSVRLAKAKGTQ